MTVIPKAFWGFFLISIEFGVLIFRLAVMDFLGKEKLTNSRALLTGI
jgi:hypothetical protein